MKRFPKLLRNASSGLARQRSTTPESSTAQWQLKVQPVQRGPEIHRIEEGDDPSMFIEGSLEVKLPNFQQYGQMKSRDGKSQRREEKRRRKKIQVREKVGKSGVTPFFQWVAALEGGKVGSLKRRVRSHVARWEMTSCMPLWREAHVQVKSAKNWQSRTNVGRLDVVSRGRRKGLCTLSKVRKTWGFCSSFKNDGRRGTFEEDLERWISRGRRSTRDMFIRDVRRSGRWFPERGCILEHQIFRFAKMILRDKCSTSYDLASLFRGRRSTLDRWSGQIAKRIGTRPSALH